ncbi:MAG: RagB/SusD family nutrient uptake outer membrane protein [Longimicrobiales bacterium]
MSLDRKSRRPRSRLTHVAAALLSVPLMAGCGDLLDVDNESDILDEDLNTPEAVTPVVNGVAGDFGTFYTETAHNVGLAAFELWHTGSHGDDRETDEGFMRRPSSQGNGGYNDASRAYWVATDAQRRIREAFADSADLRPEMAEVLVWGGFTLLMAADNWCAFTFDAGPAVTPDEVYQRAEADFTRAIEVATAANSLSWQQRAVAGRARARLFLGNFAGAIADAQLIPNGFEFDFNYSSNDSREYNHYPGHTRDQYRREVGVHPRFFDDPARWSDPRTPMNDWGPDAVGPDAIRRWVEQDKYPAYDSDMSVSSWREIRLIEAEAELNQGNLQRAVDLMNETRAFWELAPHGTATSTAQVLDWLRWERSAELWLQGQSLLDLRRFDDPLLDVPPGRGGGATRDSCWEIGEDEWLSNPNLGATAGG